MRRRKTVVAVFGSLQEGFKEGGVEAFPAGEPLTPGAEKFEAKWRDLLCFVQKRWGKELVRVGDGSDDQRPPAHLKQIFQHGGAAGETVHASAYAIAEVEQLKNEGVERLALGGGAGEEGDRAALQILVYVLQVISQLEEHAPLEGEAAFCFGEPASGQAGVGQDGCASLGAAHAQKLGAGELVSGGDLRDALLLRLVDGEEAVEDLRMSGAGILLLDQPDHGPERGFPAVAGRMRLAAEAFAEALAEEDFLFGGDVFAVEVVVAVGVEEAVAEDGRGDANRLAEERLQAAGGPGVAAGLDDVGHAEVWVELPRPSRQADADGQEFVGEEMDCVVRQVQRTGGKPGEGGYDPVLHFEPAGAASRGAPGFALNGEQAFIVGLLALLLLRGAVARAVLRRWLRALPPNFDGLCDLRFDPGPAVELLHTARSTKARGVWFHPGGDAFGNGSVWIRRDGHVIPDGLWLGRNRLLHRRIASHKLTSQRLMKSRDFISACAGGAGL